MRVIRSIVFRASCNYGTVGFDLSGGANLVGSNVLVGQKGGQLDLLSAAGYNKQGLPVDMTPASSTTNFINQSLAWLFIATARFCAVLQQKLILLLLPKPTVL